MTSDGFDETQRVMEMDWMIPHDMRKPVRFPGVFFSSEWDKKASRPEASSEPIDGADQRVASKA